MIFPPFVIDPPYTGSLPIQFHYEIGNTRGLSARSISTGQNPTNSMGEDLLKAAAELVETVMAETFGVVVGSSSRAGERESIGHEESVRLVWSGTMADSGHAAAPRGPRRGLRASRGRHLQVSYEPGSLTIEDVRDVGTFMFSNGCLFSNALPIRSRRISSRRIPRIRSECVDPAMDPNTLCQKVTAGVDLLLADVPKRSTELTFRNNLDRAIAAGAMEFPEDSGVGYAGAPRSSVVVLPEIRAPEEPPADDGDDSKWVLPVVVAAAAVGVVLLALFARSSIRERRNRKEEQRFVRRSLDRDGLNEDMVLMDVEALPSTSGGNRLHRGERDGVRVSMLHRQEKQIRDNPFLIEPEGADEPSEASSSSSDSSSDSSDSSDSDSSTCSESDSDTSTESSSTEDIDQGYVSRIRFRFLLYVLAAHRNDDRSRSVGPEKALFIMPITENKMSHFIRTLPLLGQGKHRFKLF